MINKDQERNTYWRPCTKRNLEHLTSQSNWPQASIYIM